MCTYGSLAEIITIKRLECNKCGAEIYICVNCGSKFEPNRMVFCADEYHYCECCYEEVE